MEPQDRIGLAQLTNLAFDGVDLHPLRSKLLLKYVAGENGAGALMDLSVIDQLQGNREQGLAWQAKALESCTVFRSDRGSSDTPKALKKLLVFALPIDIGGNTPVEFLVPSTDFDIITYYPDACADTAERLPLPDHDIAFCAAPVDSEDAEAFFQQVRDLTRDSGTTVLNLCETMINLDRDALLHLFPHATGLRMPDTVRLYRTALETALLEANDPETLGDWGRYPLVIRPVGSHAGLGLEKICSHDDLAAYLAARQETDFFLSDYIDYASDDGQFRKYRIVFVKGQAFPCHMAIASRWDVWYLNADMQQSADKRAEEAAFMDDFDHAFGARHKACFDDIAQGVGLDYFGIDCAEDRDGNLVVFEADNSLIVHDMDCERTFPYKGRHMRRIFDAFETMLTDACPAPKPAKPGKKPQNWGGKSLSF